MRSSGPGGQHVNKTESACRVTHIPTGLAVAIQQERKQEKNKEKALEVGCFPFCFLIPSASPPRLIQPGVIRASSLPKQLLSFFWEHKQACEPNSFCNLVLLVISTPSQQVLKEKLFEMEMMNQQNQIQNDRKEQMGQSDRSDKIRTYNYPQSRITDHRTSITLYDMDKMMRGEYMDQLIDAYLEKLKKIKTDRKIKELLTNLEAEAQSQPV